MKSCLFMTSFEKEKIFVRRIYPESHKKKGNTISEHCYHMLSDHCQFMTYGLSMEIYAIRIGRSAFAELYYQMTPSENERCKVHFAHTSSLHRGFCIYSRKLRNTRFEQYFERAARARYRRSLQ